MSSTIKQAGLLLFSVAGIYAAYLTQGAGWRAVWTKRR